MVNFFLNKESRSHNIILLAELVTDSGNFLTQVNIRSSLECPMPEEVCCINSDPTLQPETPPFSPSCGTRNIEGVVTNFVGFQVIFQKFGYACQPLVSEKIIYFE